MAHLMQRWHGIISGMGLFQAWDYFRHEGWRLGARAKATTRPLYFISSVLIPMVEIFPCYKCTTINSFSRFEISPGRCELYFLTASGLYPIKDWPLARLLVARSPQFLKSLARHRRTHQTINY